MIYWQKAMISMARNRKITDFVHRNKLLNYFSKGFVGGKNEEGILKTAESLKYLGIDASIFYLGEYVEDRDIVNNTVSSLIEVIENVKNTDIHISVDPTQVGLYIDFDFCMENMNKISESIKKRRENKNDYLMLDMEDSNVTNDTLRIYFNLVEKKYPCGITLQAYLKRTLNDLEKIIEESGQKRVRLVKGAFAEKLNSFTKRDEIDRNYLLLAKKMLDKDMLKKGLCPVFATHDHRMIEKINSYALKKGIEKAQYEFEMLYGVRINLQKSIVDKGFRLRLYTPYGTDWWPYSIRRIGENPKNLIFVLRSLLGRIKGNRM